MHPSEVDEYNEQKRKDVRLRWEIGLGVAESILGRQKQINDPVAKNLLLADKLCLLVDTAIGFMHGALTEDDVDEDVKNRAVKIGKDLQTELRKLTDWIQQPTYSPDHPYGFKIMTDAKQELENAGKEEDL